MSITVDNNLAAALGLQSFEQPQEKKELGQQEFLELMLAQIKNQDPLEPMQNGDFIAQLAQFSTASGINELGSTASHLLDSLHSSQALQASALVGRSVLVAAERGDLPAGGVLKGQVDLPMNVQELHVGIFDSSGQLVTKLNLGSQSAGMAHFEWDGKNDAGKEMPAGTYQLRGEVIVGGEAYSVDTLVNANVDSVTLGRNGQGPTLNLAGIGPVGLGQVRQVL